MGLKDFYKKQVVPQLMQDFEFKNSMAVPRLEKVTVNVGLGKGLKDSNFIEAVEKTLVEITGQKPIKTKAKKSISSFKIRKGMDVGMKVTLRGARMYDFVERLISVTLPRVRDFRGIAPKIVDKNGNMSLGIRESHAFSEVKVEEIQTVHPLEVTVTTTAKNYEQGLALLKYLGFPFKS